MTEPLAEAIARAAGSTVRAARAVPGGDINAALRVELADGRAVFAKHRTDPPAGFYAAEAAGLRWLAEAAALPLPGVIAVDARFLALEWVPDAPRAGDFDARLGEGLARLHRAGADRPGHTADDGPTFLGPLELPSTPSEDADDWPAFYAQRRIAPLLRIARDTGSVEPGTARRLDRVVDRMDALAGPPEPPARLHGDLWSGNVMAGPDGGPVLVDCAAYGGHREVDLAMLELFGRPGRDFHAAYAATHPLADGYRDRIPLWQLLPLLVHAILFGGGYGRAVDSATRRLVH